RADAVGRGLRCAEAPWIHRRPCSCMMPPSRRTGGMADTIVHRLFDQAKKRPDAPAYLVKQNGVWHATSWSEYASQVETAARALIRLGFRTGDRTCILGFNRPEWTIFDLATMAA